MVFDGGTISDPTVLRLPADEPSDWALVEPDRLGEYLPPLQTRRANAALRAREAGHAVYLQDGRVRS